MEFILEGFEDYEILFVHQSDSRHFNRGAIKNIGFLAVKEKYPNKYQDITLIFNDVDTLPFHKLFDYETTEGTIKHYYGFETALGGIVVIKAKDFERINGYPNYWGWGMEDACLQKRAVFYNLNIDRSHFYPIGSPEILQLFDGVERLVCQKDPQRMKTDNGQDGIRTIHRLCYTIDNESLNPLDNIYVVENEKTSYVNVTHFLTIVPHEKNSYHSYDLRDPVSKLVYNDNPPTNKSFISSNEWKNIPEHARFNQPPQPQYQQPQYQQPGMYQNQQMQSQTYGDQQQPILSSNV
jgi:hypothetical protein